MNPPEWGDPVVRAGMRRMLENRSIHREAGESILGWKLGFGSPIWREKFGLTGPLVGFLSESRRHRPGAEVSCVGWTHPVAEPEIAVHLGEDVVHPERAVEAISGVGAAIELADVDPPPEDVEEVLAGNIFHRAVVLGAPDPTRVDGDVTGMRARVTKNGSEVADTTDLEVLTGGIISSLVHTAQLLVAAGERLRAGEVVIMGSVITPIPVQPGDEVTLELAPLDPISVRV